MTNKNISIAMMTTLSGGAFKAPQMPCIIKRMNEAGILGNVFGIWSEKDAETYVEEMNHIHTSKALKYIFSINVRLCRFLSINHYSVQEKIYGLFAIGYKYPGEYILLKPCPNFLVKIMKRRGKNVIIEASENHPRFTQKALMKEANSFGLKELDKTGYIDERHIRDFERSIHCADYLICFTKFSAKTYIQFGFPKEKIIITGLSVYDEKKIQLFQSFSSISFVSVAHHGFLKGTHRLIELWNRKHIKNKLIIIGSINNELCNYINKQRVNDNIEYKGVLSRREIYDLYLSMPCVHILISVSESYGRSVYEGLCHGVPQVVSPTCTCDYVEDGYNGFIVDTDDAEKLEKIISYLSDVNQEEYRRLQLNAYNSISHDKYFFEERYINALLKCTGDESQVYE